MCNDDRSSEIVCFAPEKTRSASEDIAGIEKISIVIDDRRGNLDLCAGLIHQKINEPTSIKRASETYCSNSSRLSTGGCTCFLAIHQRNEFLLLLVAASVGSTLRTRPVEERYDFSQKVLRLRFVLVRHSGSQS